jgi:hypothetical protein
MGKERGQQVVLHSTRTAASVQLLLDAFLLALSHAAASACLEKGNAELQLTARGEDNIVAIVCPTRGRCRRDLLISKQSSCRPSSALRDFHSQLSPPIVRKSVSAIFFLGAMLGYLLRCLFAVCVVYPSVLLSVCFRYSFSAVELCRAACRCFSSTRLSFGSPKFPGLHFKYDIKRLYSKSASSVVLQGYTQRALLECRAWLAATVQ